MCLFRIVYIYGMYVLDVCVFGMLDVRPGRGGVWGDTSPPVCVSLRGVCGRGERQTRLDRGE
jgi:hypothetical protein